MFTVKELAKYKKLLNANPHIIQTMDVEPVCIPLNNRKKWNKEEEKFETSADFLKAKNELLAEFA
ncbi:MAG: hypothetical protein EBT51_10850 [Flavobacteriaceae bacterium]|nr:hypothetical protein [Flavobacteriaceae bacterium]